MIEVVVPKDSVNDDTVLIKKIFLKSGNSVFAGDVVLEYETSKTVIEVDAPENGVLIHDLSIGDSIRVGQKLFLITNTELNGGENEVHDNQSEEVDSMQVGRISKLSRLAQKKLDASGYGSEDLGGGWLTSRDIEAFLAKKLESISKNGLADDNPLSDLSSSTADIAEPLNRRKIAEIAALSLNQVNSLTSSIGIEFATPSSRMVDPPYLFLNNISDLVVYEGSRLLRWFPELNAVYDGGSIIKHQNINFGWSFDNGNNLKVLSIDNADQLTLEALHERILALLELYESNINLPISLLTGSTVTISDLTSHKLSYMRPLLNGRQSMILGVVSKEKNVFSIYATFDHRISNGLQVSNFLMALRDRVLSNFYDDVERLNLTCNFCERDINDEINLGNRGFLKISLPTGQDGNICRNCYEGI